ncbi:hypothetical protein RCF98_15695 [Thiothrix lacustris]|uniref:O-antigen polymerase n=1 Tax=Thiothrix lacustris TaxID=525917 RepID=A0ABY9MP05_9GAMM|nr:hypothetical protein [Thiothrix lacustris]WML90401.1 hypothetical protein RCF98_15695 [Thiothrix lacustris]
MKYISSTIQLLFFSFLIYTPYFKIGSISVSWGYLVLTLPLLFFLKKGSIKYNKDIIIVFQSILFSFFVVAIIYVMNILRLNESTIDTRGIKIHIIAIIIFFSTFFIYKNYYSRMETFKLLRLVYFSLLINPILVILLFLSESFAEFLYQYISINPRIFTTPPLRYPGFSYDGTSYLSSFHALVFSLGWILFFDPRKQSLIQILILILSQLIIFVSMMFIGRSGLIVAFLGILMLIFYLSKNKLIFKLKTFYKISFLIVAAIIAAFQILIIINFLGYGWYVDWAFSFLGFEERDTSIDELLNNHYFLPGSWSDLLIGNSDFGTDPLISSFHSDVGYVKYIFGSGIIGLIAFLIIIFNFIKISIKYFRVKPQIAYMCILISASLLLTNFKDFYFFYPYTHYILLFFMFFALTDKKRDPQNG